MPPCLHCKSPRALRIRFQSWLLEAASTGQAVAQDGAPAGPDTGSSPHSLWLGAQASVCRLDTLLSLPEAGQGLKATRGRNLDQGSWGGLCWVWDLPTLKAEGWGHQGYFGPVPAA